MELLSFKIQGKLAHFRKYYANNTALSFSIPPRTTVMGIVAAFMGLAKDSYYESLASENIRIAIRVLTPLKKSFHRLNLLSIKSPGDISKGLSSDFRGEGGRIQTPFEIVSPWDITKGELIYQVFLAPTPAGREIFQSIKQHFLTREPMFNTALGAANFTASVHTIQALSESDILQLSSNDFVLMHAAIPTKLIDDFRINQKESGISGFIEEDLMPGDFVSNGNREVRKMNRLLFSTTQSPLDVKLNSPYYRLTLKDEVIHIQFVDS